MIKNILYRAYLWFRAHSYSEKQLSTQLQKRGHNLDKQITERDFSNNNYAYEVGLLVNTALKKNFSDKELYEWADRLLLRFKYRTATETKIAKANSGRGFESIVRERRSVRSWSSSAVSDTDIEECIEVAKWAPSSCNRQLTRVLILKDRQDVDFVVDLFFKQPFVKKASVLLLIITEDKYADNEKHFAYLDSAAFVQTLMLAFESRGIGSCWLGIKNQKDFEQKNVSLRKKFNIESSCRAVSLIAVGKPNMETTPPPRKNYNQIVINHVQNTKFSKK